MSNNVRVGDRVYLTHHMSNKGVITEIFFRNVSAGIRSGPLSKQMYVKFISELNGQEVVAKRQDVRKDD
tara:strand:- start:385 stop:591 length:207 start_codon:yes stop_codon:yes gene_type:complete